ncbi:unannotated protein [freshwater metagenome]|uniref:Unannotated protein n=1 Tax=freshwater metagenome TaxID=449393 RepID=A0A6J7CWR7_9ZZZZ
MTRLVAIARMAGLLVLGAVIGLLGAFVQADREVVEFPWGLTAIPWGAIVVIVVLIASIRGAAWAVRTRLGGWLVFLGWVLSTIAMAAESPSGDLAISGGGRQMTYLLGGVILGAAAATFPVFERPSHTIEESSLDGH